MKLREVAEVIGGELRGDTEADIHGVAGTLDVKEGEITFLENLRLLKECAASDASCVIVKDFIPEIEKHQIIVKNPKSAFARLLELFSIKPSHPEGIHRMAYVAEGVRIGKGVSIYPFAYVSEGATIGERTVIYPGVFIGNNTTLGADCILYPNVTVREGVTIGNRVIVHAGAVIGSDGFGYVFEGGAHKKIPQVGGVIIGDDVEIGANVTIDRATTGNTVIGKGTKIDNLVQIAHNVTVGEHSILVAQVGIAGSTKIGNFVMLGGQVGVADHAKIDDGCMVGAQSGVRGHLAKGIHTGSPTVPHKEFLKASILFAKLPEMHRRIKRLEEQLGLIKGEAE
jgi:UDP-3-O-[3-hydroxymyristoyl] glucosamine N-acyltransferase